MKLWREKRTDEPNREHIMSYFSFLWVVLPFVEYICILIEYKHEPGFPSVRACRISVTLLVVDYIPSLFWYSPVQKIFSCGSRCIQSTWWPKCFCRHPVVYRCRPGTRHYRLIHFLPFCNPWFVSIRNIPMPCVSLCSNIIPHCKGHRNKALFPLTKHCIDTLMLRFGSLYSPQRIMHRKRIWFQFIILHFQTPRFGEQYEKWRPKPVDYKNYIWIW